MCQVPEGVDLQIIQASRTKPIASQLQRLKLIKIALVNEMLGSFLCDFVYRKPEVNQLGIVLALDQLLETIVANPVDGDVQLLELAEDFRVGDCCCSFCGDVVR